jgi:hypothetical protein
LEPVKVVAAALAAGAVAESSEVASTAITDLYGSLRSLVMSHFRRAGINDDESQLLIAHASDDGPANAVLVSELARIRIDDVCLETAWRLLRLRGVVSERRFYVDLKNSTGVVVGDNSMQINIHAAEPPVVQPVAEPFKFHGRNYFNAHDLAKAFANDPDEALACFTGPVRHYRTTLHGHALMDTQYPGASLAAWLGHIDARGFPLNALYEPQADPAPAELLLEFVATFAPDIRPTLRNTPADAAGLADLCRRAIEGDTPACALIDGLNENVMRSLARHHCYQHEMCGVGGCAVLADAWRRWDGIGKLIEHTAQKAPQPLATDTCALLAILRPDFLLMVLTRNGDSDTHGRS